MKTKLMNMALLGAVLLVAAFACLVGAWVCTILDVRR